MVQTYVFFSFSLTRFSDNAVVVSSVNSLGGVLIRENDIVLTESIV